MLASRFEPRAAPVALTGRRRPLLGPPGRPPGPSGRRREAGGGPPQCRPGAGRLGRVRFAGGSPAHGAAAAATSPLRRLAPLGLAAAAMAGGRRHRSRPIAGCTPQTGQTSGGERPRTRRRGSFPRAFTARGRWFHALGAWAAGRRADRIITGTAAAAAELAEHLSLPAERVRVVPYGVDLPGAQPSPDEHGRGPPPLRLERPALRVVGRQPGAPQGGGTLVTAMAQLARGAGSPAPALVLAGYPGLAELRTAAGGRTGPAGGPVPPYRSG